MHHSQSPFIAGLLSGRAIECYGFNPGGSIDANSSDLMPKLHVCAGLLSGKTMGRIMSST